VTGGRSITTCPEWELMASGSAATFAYRWRYETLPISQHTHSRRSVSYYRKDGTYVRGHYRSKGR
jgi:hypothetical protein